MTTVPPRKVIVKDEKLDAINGIAGPYDEGSEARLTCEAKGGK